MPTKKKGTAPSKSKKSPAAAKKTKTATEDPYQGALTELHDALELLHKGEYDEAKKQFMAIQSLIPEETGLVDRARSYISICDRRTAAPADSPRSEDDLYYAGVLLANQDRLEEALDMFNRALQIAPESPSVLYARALVRAKEGNSEDAVTDLKHAISIKPALRFQLVNDSDFENIRDEAAFIDLIEPTPAGD